VVDQLEAELSLLTEGRVGPGSVHFLYQFSKELKFIGALPMKTGNVQRIVPQEGAEGRTGERKLQV
jgi:hypothetical protein